MTMNSIESNLFQTGDRFLGKLKEGEFSQIEFNKLVKTIYDIHNSNPSNEVRLKTSCEVWEIAFQIAKSIAFHNDPNDLFTIKNLTEDKKNDLLDSIFLMSNYLAYNKPMQLEQLFL